MIKVHVTRRPELPGNPWQLIVSCKSHEYVTLEPAEFAGSVEEARHNWQYSGLIHAFETMLLKRATEI